MKRKGNILVKLVFIFLLATLPMKAEADFWDFFKKKQKEGEKSLKELQFKRQNVFSKKITRLSENQVEKINPLWEAWFASFRKETGNFFKCIRAQNNCLPRVTHWGLQPNNIWLEELPAEGIDDCVKERVNSCPSICAKGDGPTDSRLEVPPGSYVFHEVVCKNNHVTANLNTCYFDTVKTTGEVVSTTTFFFCSNGSVGTVDLLDLHSERDEERSCLVHDVLIDHSDHGTVRKTLEEPLEVIQGEKVESEDSDHCVDLSDEKMICITEVERNFACIVTLEIRDR